MASLYVVATPIGNLGDVSERALAALRDSSVIFAEDTRVTGKLTAHFGIRVSVRRYNEHAPDAAFRETRERLKRGENISLVSDSGTPGISDPGVKLVAFVAREAPNAKIVPIPGPSAAVAALSVSGMPANEFTFLGFPPAKRKRKAFFARVAVADARPVVIYEAPHRIAKTLGELAEAVGEDVPVFVARELTKMYEEHLRGTLGEVKKLLAEREKARGEFVIVVA